MAPPALTVSRTDLLGAGTAVSSTSATLAGGLNTLFETLNGCGGMCGDDPAGIMLAHHTDNATHAVVKALTDSVNGTARLGDAIKASASNYDHANHHSSVAPVSGAPIPFPAATPQITPHYPVSPEGGAGEPRFWKAVESLIGMIWPNGDPAKLRTAARAWRAIATTCHNTAAQLKAPATTCDTQKIPEAPSIDALLTKSTGALNSAGAICTNLAIQLENYAAHIEDVHQKLHDLVKRIGNPASLGSEVIGFFTGRKGDIDKIIGDIKTVLGNFATEVGEVGALIGSYAEEAMQICLIMAEMLAVELKQVVVKPVYNGLATLVNAVASSANFTVHHPLEILETVGGAALAAAGATTFIAGLPADATVVGSPAGLALNAAGPLGTATGIGMMGKGIHDLASSADSNSGVTVMHAMSDGDGVDPNLGRDGVNSRYSGDLRDSPNEYDPDADRLSERLGGRSQVHFDNDPAEREFDTVSDEYVGQAKPGGFRFGKPDRVQAKATFEAAQQTGRSVYYHFNGEPNPSAIRQLNEYSDRYGVPVVIDTDPFQ